MEEGLRMESQIRANDNGMERLPVVRCQRLFFFFNNHAIVVCVPYDVRPPPPIFLRI